ncbi:helix-turn-helix domain-containing protein [Streptomyces sp. STCH 565 A]|uniref:helix-turn-helix domain-containing protein n=1 Tax=Streptomyces sp. STCH 565 A TaxID=2950532 RepID=UPI0020755C64|nr:helix-turn-helix transcriptional regulator [Streptomyces sp. STCH 565 A]MCM8553994.1 helix-turn-helix domain-containing protein [Streptomyces sp. STCH 565 A]
MHHPPLPAEHVLARRRAIGTRMRAARLHANLTQETVALRADIRIATYSRIENGHASPVLDTLIRIADALDVPLADLVR